MGKSTWAQYRSLLGYARPYKKWAALQFSMMGFSIAIALLKPWPLKVLLDNVVGGLPLEFGAWRPEFSASWLLAAACAAYLLIHAGDSLVQLVSANVAAFSSSKMIRDLRSDCMGRLQALSPRYHDQQKVGDLVHRIAYNTAAVETAFQSGFMGAVKSGLMLVCLFVVMMLMNPLLTGVALAIAPLLLLCIRIYAKRIHQVSRAHQDQEGSVSSSAQETLSAIRLIQAFNRQEFEQERFEETCEGSVRTRLKTTMVQKFFGLSTALILALGTALLFWAGIRQTLAGQLTIGEFILFIAYLSMLYAPLSVLSYTASSVQSALGGASRLFEILEAPNEIQDADGAAPLPEGGGAVRFESVDFGYLRGQTVLAGIDFHAEPGETVAIAGETGSGKSTLLNLILRFYDPRDGAIFVNGQDIRGATLHSLREAVGLVPQETLLLSGSIRENIAYGRPGATQEEIEAAARRAQAHEFIMKTQDGYETLAGERGIRLSAGQRQRISLARALLKDPQILLLDEPTSALDAETERRVLDSLDSFRGRRTIIFVTHRLSAARGADRIVVLKDGRIQEQGKHQELIELGGLYHRMWRAQTESRAPVAAERA